MAILDEESLLATCAYIEGFSLDNYLLLVEYTGRLFREGKAVISGELAGVFERLGSNAENWQARLQKLAAGRLLSRFFAASRARLRDARKIPAILSYTMYVGVVLTIFGNSV